MACKFPSFNNSPVLKSNISLYDSNYPTSISGNDFIDSITPIPLLDEGVKAHKEKETSKAWEIFCEHANLGSTKAKFWKGYYLWEGYAGEKDRKQASKLFKEAADDGLADAQLHYAFSLVSNQGSKFDRKLFFEYLTKAADNNNSAVLVICI